MDKMPGGPADKTRNRPSWKLENLSERLFYYRLLSRCQWREHVHGDILVPEGYKTLRS